MVLTELDRAIPSLLLLTEADRCCLWMNSERCRGVWMNSERRGGGEAQDPVAGLWMNTERCGGVWMNSSRWGWMNRTPIVRAGWGWMNRTPWRAG